MFGIFKKKPPTDRSKSLKWFQALHPLDAVYENDLNGVRTQDPQVQEELNRMVDLACSASSFAKIQRVVLRSQSPDPHDKFELGYIFGCVDFYKACVWGVQDFNRSFFHCSFLNYFGDVETADTALLNLGIALADNDSDFLAGAKEGQADVKAMLTKSDDES